MEQTILQLPMHRSQTLGLGRSIGVIYQHPPLLMPVQEEFAGASGHEIRQETLAMPDVKIGKRRRHILEALNICQDLSVDQLQHYLRLSPASIPYLREHLRVLERGNFVEVSAPAKQTFYG